MDFHTTKRGIRETRQDNLSVCLSGDMHHEGSCRLDQWKGEAHDRERAVRPSNAGTGRELFTEQGLGSQQEISAESLHLSQLDDTITAF